MFLSSRRKCSARVCVVAVATSHGDVQISRDEREMAVKRDASAEFVVIDNVDDMRSQQRLLQASIGDLRDRLTVVEAKLALVSTAHNGSLWHSPLLLSDM